MSMRSATHEQTLAALIDAYTIMADVRHQWPGRSTLKGQAVLCAMRDAIADETGEDGNMISGGVVSAIVRRALEAKAR